VLTGELPREILSVPKPSAGTLPCDGFCRVLGRHEGMAGISAALFLRRPLARFERPFSLSEGYFTTPT
jgi:hypothetical protein